jgi:hypothetical protein
LFIAWLCGCATPLLLIEITSRHPGDEDDTPRKTRTTHPQKEEKMKKEHERACLHSTDDEYAFFGVVFCFTRILLLLLFFPLLGAVAAGTPTTQCTDGPSSASTPISQLAPILLYNL